MSAHRTATLAALLALGACATPVDELGGGAYSVSARTGSLTGGAAGARHIALAHAAAFCHERGLPVTVLSINGHTEGMAMTSGYATGYSAGFSGYSGAGPSTADVVFTCSTSPPATAAQVQP